MPYNHILISVHQLLHTQFPIKCTGKDDALVWPPSPDLTLLDFSCRGGGT